MPSFTDGDSVVEALFDAAWKNDLEAINRLLHGGAPVNAIRLREPRMPALWAAIENNAPEAADCLLHRGADPTTWGNEHAITPLGMAVVDAVIRVTDNVDPEPDLRMVTTLIRYGAAPAQTPCGGYSSVIAYAHALAAQDCTRELGEKLLAVTDRRRDSCIR